MNEKILFVDDDAHIRQAIQRRQQLQFKVETAGGGGEGLALIDSQGPFAVVVADMRMPLMNGIQFLARVKERSPNSVRMILTGNTDLQTAIDAVNEGNIFRFLTKPCPPAIMASALKAGIEQYRLITAERELLEKTLRGGVQVLTEILSLVNPPAFSRASRASRMVADIVAELQLPNAWQFEIAIRLSQIGCVTLPPAILDKVYKQIPLLDNEQRMFLAHPSVGRELLAHIPRLETIAQMIAKQQQPAEAPIPPGDITSEEDQINLGAQLLKLALDYDEEVSRGLSHRETLSIMQRRGGMYNPYLINVLEKLQGAEVDTSIKEITVDELHTGMIADQDILARGGLLLVHKGQEVTHPILIRLRHFAEGIGVVEPFRVRAPTQYR